MAVDTIGLLPLVYYCDACGTPGPDLESAKACCGFGIDGPVGVGYCCPICDMPFDAEADAIACCGWDRTPEGARTARARLEAAGQLALEV